MRLGPIVGLSLLIVARAAWLLPQRQRNGAHAPPPVPARRQPIERRACCRNSASAFRPRTRGDPRAAPPRDRRDPVREAVQPADLFTSYFVPRPHVGGSVNFDGQTSFAYAGLTWSFDIAPRFFVEAAIGGAVQNDGTNPFEAAFTGPDRSAARRSFARQESSACGSARQLERHGDLEHMSDGGACSANRRLDEYRRARRLYILSATAGGIPRMVVLNRIYTRTGDKGTTALATGERRPKHDLRIAAYGTVDETNACLGLARLHTARPRGRRRCSARIQNDLFDLGADLATPATGKPPPYEPLRIVEAQVERLEREIDELNAASVGAALLRPAGRHACCGGPPSRAHRLPPRRAARRRACRPARRGGVARCREIPQPAVGFPLRRLPLRQRQGRARRALGARPEPLIGAADVPSAPRRCAPRAT